VAERQALRDAVEVGRMNDLGLGEAAAALGVFGLGQVPAAGGKADGFAGGGDFEPLGHGFFRFDAFGTSHNFNSIAKECGIYVIARCEASAIFPIPACRVAPLKRYGLLVFNSDGTGKTNGAELAGVMSIGAPALSCFSTSAVKSTSPLL
jgi:hypothetical protein